MYHLVFEIFFRDIAQSARQALERVPIDNEWRGWRYEEDKFRPPYDGPQVTISQILGLPEGNERHENQDRMAGDLIHSLYHQLLKVASSSIQGIKHRDEMFGIGKFVAAKRDETVKTVIDENEDVTRALKTGATKTSWVESQESALCKIWDYESGLLAALVAHQCTAYPGYSKATIAARCVPFESEIECDGGLFQLSKNLRIDARMTHHGSIIVDIKTGTKSNTNRLAMAGYALAWESRESTPIDIGCVYYVHVPPKKPTPLIDCDVFPFTTTLRQSFIEKRNEALKGVNEGA